MATGMAKERVGIIGVGRMGLAMAKHLIKHGYVLTVCDINTNNLEQARALGAAVAATPTEEVRKRERASRSGEKDDRDEHFTPFDQGDEVAEKLREGFAGEAEGLAPA